MRHHEWLRHDQGSKIHLHERLTSTIPVIGYVTYFANRALCGRYTRRLSYAHDRQRVATNQILQCITCRRVYIIKANKEVFG